MTKNKLKETIKTMRSTGMTQSSIARELTSKGVTTPSGAIIRQAYVSLMLRRKPYTKRKLKTETTQPQAFNLYFAKVIVNSNLPDKLKIELLTKAYS